MSVYLKLIDPLFFRRCHLFFRIHGVSLKSFRPDPIDFRSGRKHFGFPHDSAIKKLESKKDGAKRAKRCRRWAIRLPARLRPWFPSGTSGFKHFAVLRELNLPAPASFIFIPL